MRDHDYDWLTNLSAKFLFKKNKNSDTWEGRWAHVRAGRKGDTGRIENDFRSQIGMEIILFGGFKQEKYASV
jgi:hypothetical protein